MADLHDVLSTIPIFSFLGRAELAAVQELFVESTHQKGDAICRIGEEGDTFHVVLDGELEVLAGEKEDRIIAVLKRGDFFGEMALLQGGKRTATVMATRRVRLMTLDRTSFNGLFLKNPKALEYFTRVLCKRLTSTTRGESLRGSTMTISVGTAHPSLKGKTLIATCLAGALHDLTGADVLLVTVSPGEEAAQGAVGQLLSDSLGVDSDAVKNAIKQNAAGVWTLDVPARTDLPVTWYEERASNLISKLTDRFSFMVFDLGAEPRGLIHAVPMFSDVFVEIVDAPEPAPPAEGETKDLKRFRVINLFNGSRRIPISHCEPFVVPRDSSLANGNAPAYVRTNPRSSAGLPIQRLARKILGATVGVALGGGAAFGIAHLGVLKVLEENGIPIDLLAGCSQGSIIGVGYAAGIGTRQMIEMALQLGKRGNALLAVDLTLTKPGFLAGNRFVGIFTPLLGKRTTFEDLVLPCQTVATDIESGARVPIGRGSLTAAFRASASVPMVFSPVRIGDSVLVDGGVSDPVPAEVVNAMGADLCIAFNVVPPLKKGVENAVSHLYRTLNRLNPLSYLGGSADLPNMFDIIMNAMQTLQYELGNFKAISADVLINPELSDFTWVEYYRSDELIQRGVDAATRALPAINRAYAQKLAPWRKRES
jgi:NTE family protein